METTDYTVNSYWQIQFIRIMGLRIQFVSISNHNKIGKIRFLNDQKQLFYKYKVGQKGCPIKELL